MKKALISLGIVLGVTAISLLACCGGLGYRNFDAGVNPLREIKRATLGESIEVKESVESDGRTCRHLEIDGIAHGTQYQGKKHERFEDAKLNWPRVPTTYYSYHGPVGMAFSKYIRRQKIEQTWPAADDARPVASLVAHGFSQATGALAPLVSAWSQPPVGVIMMNNGTMAAYARPLQFLDFYESSPKIAELSLSNDAAVKKFTYIDDAKGRGANIRIFEGNERKTFEKEAPRGFYQLLIVDTSHGHPGLPSKELFTKEAMQMYVDAMVEQGVICFHTSSRDYDLTKVVAATASAAKLAHLRVHDSRSNGEVGHYTSEWVLVARKQEYLRYILDDKDVLDRHPVGGPPGTLVVETVDVRPGLVFSDGGSNSLSAVRR